MRIRNATYYQWRCSKQNLPTPPPQHGAAWCAIACWAHPDIPFALPADDDVSATDAYVVRVNDGRWMVDCPCGASQIACKTDHRMFCPHCLNGHVGGAWIITIWPADADDIEAVLSLRPFAMNQHWKHGETVEDLRAENTEHGIL